MRKDNNPRSGPASFVLFAHARSGSTSLAKSLDSHPDLRVCIEPFHHKYASWNRGAPNYVELVIDRPSLECVLAEIFATYRGIKVLDYQLPEDLYSHMLLLPSHKVILLRRRNLLQATVSGLIAEQTGVWQVSDLNASRREAYDRLSPIPLEEISKRLKYQAELQHYYRAIVAKREPGDLFRLDYEDLYTADLDRNLSTLHTLFSFLRVGMPDSGTFEPLLDPERAKIGHLMPYRLVPNSQEIDRCLGTDETGWLLRE